MFKRNDEEILKLFDNAKTREDIADLLEINEKSLRYFLFVVRPENMYTIFTIPKKRIGVRRISAPANELCAIQRKLAYILSLKYNPKICAYGFIKGKNIIGNANQHTKKNEILNIDLKDYFTQFHFGRIVGLLVSKPYSIGKEAAITIAQISCFNGVLPQGAPTSPILTNMLCAPLDNQLMKFAKKHGLVYTRYADDITFSSYNRVISDSLIIKNGDKIILNDALKQILQKNNVIENPEKITLRTRNARQEVTGLVVNKFPNIKREYYKNIRALLYNCKKNGIYKEALKYIDKGFCKNRDIVKYKDEIEKSHIIEEWYKTVLRGKVNFIKQIKGDNSFAFYTLAKVFNEVVEESAFDLSYFNRINDIIDKNVFVLQNNDETSQGSCFFVPGYGLFTSYHVTQDGDFYYIWSNDEKVISTPVSNLTNQKSADDIIDYALYNVNIPNIVDVSIGCGGDLEIGDTVIIAGFPDYINGDTITKEECKITGKTKLFGAPFYKISGRIAHGASGGIVLNTNYEVVGIIKGGCPSDDENNINIKQGFVPIDLAIEDLCEKKIIK